VLSLLNEFAGNIKSVSKISTCEFKKEYKK
jgi:hypothetical protein